MANLTYSNIFTNVHKWDEEYTYLGIQVTGKFNQYNGQDFYILDAIDIDWNGAFVEKLNTYVYSTEDIINLFNILEDQNINIENNYISKIEFESIADDVTANIAYIVEERVFANILNRYEILNAISDILIDKTKYLEIDYNNIVENGKLTDYGLDRDFFIYDENRNIFIQVEKSVILNNPNQKYYIFLLTDIIKLNNDMTDIKKIIGKSEYNINNNSYTYTGFYNRFFNIENNISYISYYLDNNTYITLQAYNYAYSSYITSYNNSYLIGEPSVYNVYKKVTDTNSEEFREYLRKNYNNIWVKEPNSDTYTSINYNGNPNLEYYMFYNKLNGYGIQKKLEDIEDNISENSYLLYKLSVESEDNNLSVRMTGNIYDSNRPKDRKIILDIKNSYIDSYTGEITEGIIDHNNIVNAFNYVLKWENIKK